MTTTDVFNQAYECGVKYLVFVRDDEADDNRWEGFIHRTDALWWMGENVKNGLTHIRLWWLPEKGTHCEVKFTSRPDQQTDKQKKS